MALDLAIQAAGLVSMPVTDLSNLKAAQAWASPAGTAGPEGLEHVALPGWEVARAAAFPDRPAGGVWVDGEITQEELIAEAERLQQVIGGEERQIVVAGRPPERWPDRALLAWATVAGAAVLLSPDPASLVSSALWARATVFQGSAAEVAALRRALEPKPPRFWRLRVVLCDEPVEEGFWRERGVQVRPLTP